MFAGPIRTSPSGRDAYDHAVDPTWQAALGGLVGAFVTGGAVLAWYLSERQQRANAPTPEPVLPAGVASVLAVLRSSAVVIGEDDLVVKASAPAYAWGMVRNQTLAVPELVDLMHDVRRDGQIRDTEMVMQANGSAERHVFARVAPLGARLILVLVEDRTRERRVEAVRRDFVANVSHELKTPVGAMRLLAEAVQDAADDPEAIHRFSNRMLIESDRLTTLVKQIIELGRLQGDGPLDAPNIVDVDTVTSIAVDTSSIDAAAHEIRLITGGESGLEVLGSTEQITTAVSNLVANAVAYSGDTSAVVVNAKGTPSTVEISVIDQGIGIPEGDVERIFERFYRVDPARHRSTGGTGLGLSIVKHVAATHGGDVRVWSIEGQGSTFTLTLPRHVKTEEV